MRRRPVLHVLVGSALALSGAVVAVEASAVPVWTPGASLDARGHGISIASNAAGQSVAVWLHSRTSGDDVVMSAFRPAGGAWSAPLLVSGETHMWMGTPKAVIDGAGRATVVWTATDPGPNDAVWTDEVHVASRGTKGAWSADTNLTSSAYGGTALVVDPAGTATVSWPEATQDCTPVPCTLAASDVVTVSRPAGGAWGARTTAVGDFAGSPDLSASPDGSLDLVATRRTGGSESMLEVVHTHRAAAGSWTAPLVLSTTGAGAVGVPVVASDSTGVTAAWGECDTATCRVRAATGAALGTAQTLAQTARPSKPGLSLALAADTHGGTTAVWSLAADARVLASRHSTSGWESPATLATAATGAPTVGQAAADADGDVVATWSDQSTSAQRALVAHRPAGGSWGTTAVVGSNAVNRNGYAPPTTPGIAATGGRRFTAVFSGPTGVSYSDRVDDVTPPTARMVRPGSGHQISTTVPLEWTGSDSQAGIARYDVRSRAATWRGAFGPHTMFRTGTTYTSSRLAGVQGRTYCFSVRATDRAGLTGPWSGERCTSTPVDDRAARVSAGWRRTRSSGSFLGTETVSSTYGKRLAWAGGHGKRYALVATTCRSCGSVTVSQGGRTLRKISLRTAGTHHRRVFPIASFATVHTSKVVVTITSHRKPVRVDGIVVGR